MKNFLMCKLKFQTENQLFKYKLKGMIKLYKTPKPIKNINRIFDWIKLHQLVNMLTNFKKIVMNLGQLTSNIFTALRTA